MARTVNVKLGLNGAFATRRWEDPATIVRLTRELGYTCLEHCGDIVDPFFMGDTAWQLEFADQTRRAAEREGVEIWDVYTGMTTHRTHGLGHSHPAVRRRTLEWMVRTMDIALAMGARRIGGHLDAIPVERLQPPAVYEQACREIYEQWREAGNLATIRGMAAIYWEQMYIPSEIPWTLNQQQEALLVVNRDRPGAPVYTTLDVGHCAGQQYGMSGADADHREWLRRFGGFAEVIHLQQTTPESSAHWAFTEEHNQRGHIDMAQVLSALREGHEAAASSPVAEALPPVTEQRLVLEYIPGSTKCEALLLEELQLSAQYLSGYVPPEGLVWEF